MHGSGRTRLAWVSFALLMMVSARPLLAGDLCIELIAGYNFVVRSNIESQPGTSPYAAYLGATFHNDGNQPLTDVLAYIGNYDDGIAPTPGIYPSRQHMALVGPLPGGEFALSHEGGSLGLADATRYLGTIAPGESVTVYWLVSYPLVDENGKAVHGPSVKPDDDLWLKFDIWASAESAGGPVEADASRIVHMRNMLQASANKIFPNTANKVPQEYLDLLGQYEPAWTNTFTDGSVGSSIVTEGIWYDLGNINQGFDNDGDLIPDYNVWMQPVGNPSQFDAGCFRLVRTEAFLVIKRSSGPDTVIVETDQLYFSNLPPDNSGAVGYVAYYFLPLCAGSSSTLTPYQAVASGRDNEKFNADYGATLGQLTAVGSNVEMEKTVDSAIAEAGDRLTYTVTYTNTGAVALGDPAVGLPLVVHDRIPAATTYVAGSAAAGNTLPVGVAAYTIFYSTDNAATWTQTEPATAADVTDIQWWLSDPLEPLTAGAVTFQVNIDDPAPPLIYNVAQLRMGGSGAFLEDEAFTLVLGDYKISGTVFEDTGVGADGVFGNGVLDGNEPGIQGVVVSLYYDANGDGILDEDDVLFATVMADADGNYEFTGLPDGNYHVGVDVLDPGLPSGYSPTTPDAIAVVIDGEDSIGNDFGFAPTLQVVKTGTESVMEGGAVTYTIDVTNRYPTDGVQKVYTLWANAASTPDQANKQWTTPGNALGDPNGSTSSTVFANVSPELLLTGFGSGLPTGNITKVELVIVARTEGVAAVAEVDFVLPTPVAVANPFTIAASSIESASLQTYVYDVTARRTLENWNATDFTAAAMTIRAEKKSGAGPGSIFMDAVGFRITTTESTTLATVPLTDIYNADELTFVSADPVPTSHVVAGSTGTITWGNIGPIDPGDTASVTANFTANWLDAGSIVTTDTASVTGALFSNGSSANDASDTADTQILQAGSIGDTIWWDANRNASQDAGEGGIEGVTVELYDNGTLLATTVSDENGSYLFQGLPPGTYRVVVVEDGVLASATLTGHPDNDGFPVGHPEAPFSTSETVITLSYGENFLGADFGYAPPGGTIGGLLWIDFNDDGMSNSGESGIPFVTVTLYENGTPIATTTTDADGYYLFYGLPDGTYRVVVDSDGVEFPSGLTQTVDPDGTLDDEATAIVISGGSIATIGGDPWTAGDLEVNFGYRYAGNNILSGTVGMDDPDDLDGVLNGENTSGVGPNESPLAGVTVYVYLWNDLNENGVVNSGETILLGTTVTDANGDYSFANLPDGGPNGYYIVSLVAPLNNLALTTTSDNTPATLLVKNEDAQGNTISAYQAVPATADQPITNVDFAFRSTVEYDFGDLPDSYRTTLAVNGARHIVPDPENPTLYLGSLVDTEPDGLPSVGAEGDDLNDLNDEDGVFVAGIWQNAHCGATVRVQVGAGSGWLVGFIDFDNSGAFDKSNELVASQMVAFDGGPDSDGWYEFAFDVPAGSLSTLDTTFLYSRWRLFPSKPFLPALAFQDEASNGEVEDYRWGFHVIQGSVFEDTDEDADFSAGDEPQAGVVVNLYDNGTLLATTVTGLDGSYSFYGVPDGAYRVNMEVPAGATAIRDVDGDHNTFTIIAVTVVGDSVFDRDFLLDSGASVASISGTVYNDADATGTFSVGDTPEAGVVVRLYRDLHNVGIPDDNEYIGSVVTAADGTYRFEDLPDGDYLVVIETPQGAMNVYDVEGEPDDGLVAVTLSGTDVEDRDFLIRMPARISGTVRFDSVSDGTLDYDEPGVTGVVVELRDGGGNVIATTISDENGYYQFDGIEPGSYQLTLQTPSGFSNVTDADGNANGANLIDVTLVDADVTGRDFLLDEVKTYAISGTVLEDLISPGVINNPGDTPLLGVVVELRDGDGNIVATTTTDSDGNYSFENLIAGDYQVTIQTPPGATNVTDADGNVNGPNFIEVTLVDADVADRDFLLDNVTTYQISGTVYSDSDSDGAFSDGDSPLGGVTVELRDADGNVIATTVTGPDGSYSFDVVPGDYQITTVTPAGGNHVTDADGDANGSNFIEVTVINAPVTDQDFLLDDVTTIVLGDRVWLDENSNGIQDAGEPGIANVTVQIFDATGTILLGETVTDTAGSYLFKDLIAGDYVVRIDTDSMSAGLAANPTYDLDGIGTEHETAVTLAIGESRFDADFGYNWSSTDDVLNPDADATGAIGDRVWIDANGDGVQDLGEPGLGGVTVAIYYDSNGDGIYDALFTGAVDQNGNTGTGTTTTEPDGSYVFYNLPAGAYQIVVNNGDTPAGYTQTGDPDDFGTLATDPDNRTTTPIILAPGDVFVNADFGYQPVDGLGDPSGSNLSGTVYFDADANADLDGADYGVPGVTVALLDTNGVVIATTTTNADGNYTFSGLPAGDYTVWVNDTGNLLGGLYQTEDPDVTVDNRTTVSVNGVTDVTGVTFGYTPVGHTFGDGLIGDTIFLDRNGNGEFDAGEGMQGVTVELYASDGTTLLATTVTDANGNYWFGGLADGTFVVKVDTTTLPNGGTGLTNTVDPDGGTPSQSTVTLPKDPLSGPQPVFLGSAATFAVLGGSTVTSTGDTVVDGDLGVSPGTAVTGFPPGVVTNGTIYEGGATAAQAQLDLVDAYDDATGRDTTAILDAELGGKTLIPGVYDSVSGAFAITGTLTLDAQGDPNAVFIIRTTSTLITADNSLVVLSNGAQAGNVFWVVGSSATLGSSSVFSGNILANTSVTLTTNASVDGRVLAIDGAVTLDTNRITLPLTSGGNVDLDQDFGYQAEVPNTIGGTIWEDRNADGTLDGGEDGRFEGITVVLRDANGNIVGTAETDASGDYSFTGLPDGSYTVDVTDEANLLNGYWHSRGPIDGADNNSQSDPYTVVVTGGETNTTGDFGYYVEGAALGNRVWIDANANGIQDEGEEGLGGVTLRLTIIYASGVTNVITTVSDANGFYSFGNLLLDEKHTGTNAASPTFTISAINPGDGYNHTVFSKTGGEPDDSDNPNGVEATAIQGVTNVSLNEDDPYDPAEEEEQAWYDFGFTLTPTLAVITAVRSRVEDGVAVISWDVELEIDTVGYHLERWVDGAWVRVNAALIGADPFAPPPLTYEQADPEAPLGSTQRYQIVELDGRGRLLFYGPYDLELDGGEISYETWAAGIDWGDADSSRDADPDGDGLTNWQEYLAGTDPLNANSLLRITHIEPVADGVRLTWDSAAGRVYAIEITLRLTDPFIAIQRGIEATPPANSHVVPADFDAVRGAFFRVILE